MTNELQATLRYVAEKAGYYVRVSETTPESLTVWTKPVTEDDVGDAEIVFMKMFLYENANTLSDAEVTVCLGWLAKAGYEIGMTEIRQAAASPAIFVELDNYDDSASEGHGETVNEALANALKALPREDSDV